MRARPLLPVLLFSFSSTACQFDPELTQAPLDARVADAEPDAQPGDAGPDASGVPDGALDAGLDGGADAGSLDADAGSLDADAGSLDADSPDAEPCFAGDAGIFTSSTPPSRLSLTGLYTNTASKTLSAGIAPFAPAYALWSDGAEKHRFAYLPGCKKIDTSDMDNWSLPIGTRLWKEFVVDKKRIETRLIERFGPGPEDFHFVTYAWNDEETDAVLAPRAGVMNARGTHHDIPSVSACAICHRLPAKALGFSAIQLSHGGPSGSMNMASLSAAGRLTMPAPAGFTVPGDAVAQQALGYLHANCGHCHSADPSAITFRHPFVLRLSTLDLSLDAVPALTTAVGVPVERFVHTGITMRIAPGAPEASCVIYRMSVRQPLDQMPPLASEIVDPEGLAAVRAWVEAL